MMILRTFVVALVVAAVLFGAAGRLDVPAFWLYAGLWWLNAAALYTVLAQRQPDLVAERFSPPEDRDRASRALSVLLFLVHLAVAGWEARGGSQPLSLGLQIAGFASVTLGLLLVDWTLLSNPFASSAVRVQHDRAQRVIQGGPYRWVRHPMYTGVFFTVAGSGLALGSAWAALVLLPVGLVFLRRTLVEDRMLQEELEGYREYAAQVRARLVPGLF
jgi:protein-S-isoprenylcysteine O-methyltransferase Ste14